MLVNRGGGSAGDDPVKRIRAALRAHGVDADIKSVDGGNAAKLAVAAVKKGVKLVVAAGGDGTVDKVFKAMAGRSPPVAVLPLGSANNVARTLGISPDEPAVAIARSWHDAGTGMYDIGELDAADGAVRFVECMGGGIFGAVLVRAGERDEELTAEEKKGLGLDLLEAAIHDAPAYHWGLELDGEDLSGEFLAVEVMNVREIGPNVPLAPDADPGDGLLDLALVSAGHREGLAAYLREREPDHHIPPPAVRRARGRRLRARFPAGCPLHVDDELWPEGSVDGAEGEAVFTAGRLKVQVLAPSG